METGIRLLRVMSLMVRALDDLSARISLQLSRSFSCGRWNLFGLLFSSSSLWLFPGSGYLHLLPNFVLLVFILSLFECNNGTDCLVHHFKHLFLFGFVFLMSCNMHL